MENLETTYRLFRPGGAADAAFLAQVVVDVSTRIRIDPCGFTPSATRTAA
jgi:hypothetical protein